MNYQNNTECGELKILPEKNSLELQKHRWFLSLLDVLEHLLSARPDQLAWLVVQCVLIILPIRCCIDDIIWNQVLFRHGPTDFLIKGWDVINFVRIHTLPFDSMPRRSKWENT